MIPIKSVGPRITQLTNEIMDKLQPMSGKPVDLQVTIADEGEHKRAILDMLNQGNLQWAQLLLMKQAAFYTALAALITTVPGNIKKGLKR